MITSGTIHNGTPPAWKPWSSSGFISQGSTGSVAEPTSEPAIATANPARALAKYGVMRAMRCLRGCMRG